MGPVVVPTPQQFEIVRVDAREAGRSQDLHRMVSAMQAAAAKCDLATTYDGWREAVEHTVVPTSPAQMVPVKQFVHGSDLDEILAYRRFNGTSWEDYHILHGGQDTAAKLVNQSGQVVEQYEYDPFGKATVYTAAGALVDVGPAGTSPEDGTRSAYGLMHLYKAMRLDPETGNCYVRNRYYDPITGRFLSRDPIGVWGDTGNMGNEYAYAWNRPLVVGDPLGLQAPKDLGGDLAAPSPGRLFDDLADRVSGPIKDWAESLYKPLRNMVRGKNTWKDSRDVLLPVLPYPRSWSPPLGAAFEAGVCHFNEDMASGLGKYRIDELRSELASLPMLESFNSRDGLADLLLHGDYDWARSREVWDGCRLKGGVSLDGWRINAYLLGASIDRFSFDAAIGDGGQGAFYEGRYQLLDGLSVGGSFGDGGVVDGRSVGASGEWAGFTASVSFVDSEGQGGSWGAVFGGVVRF